MLINFNEINVSSMFPTKTRQRLTWFSYCLYHKITWWRVTEQHSQKVNSLEDSRKIISLPDSQNFGST